MGTTEHEHEHASGERRGHVGARARARRLPFFFSTGGRSPRKKLSPMTLYHAEREVEIEVSPEVFFDLVWDFEHYPSFVSGVAAAKVDKLWARCEAFSAGV